MFKSTAVIVALAFCASANAAVVTTVMTDADAYVFDKTYGPEQDTNYGSDPELKAGVWSYWRGKFYLHFDLSGVTGVPASGVQSARLKLNGKAGNIDPAHGPGDQDLQYYVWAIVNDTLDTFNEGTITFNNSPMYSASDNFSDQGDATKMKQLDTGPVVLNANGWDFDIDVKDCVNWVLGKNAGYTSTVDTDDDLTIGITINRTAGGAPFDDPWEWHSKESTPANAGDVPRIEIVVPEPATMGLLGLGIAVMGLRRLRRKYRPAT